MAIYNSNPTEFEKTFNNVQSDTELITHKLEEIKTKIIAKYELKRKLERYSNKTDQFKSEYGDTQQVHLNNLKELSDDIYKLKCEIVEILFRI